MSKTILAYTDGSAVVVGPKEGHGGFGTYFPNFYGKPKAFSKGFQDTKTGRVEILALYYAITAFYLNHREEIILEVYSDSQYVVKTFTEDRLEKWIANNWMSYGNQIKNVDLWEKVKEALELRPFLKLKMNHIKSHQVEKAKKVGDYALVKKLLANPHVIGNMMADKLADYKRQTLLLKSDTL